MISKINRPGRVCQNVVIVEEGVEIIVGKTPENVETRGEICNYLKRKRRNPFFFPTLSLFCL